MAFELTMADAAGKVLFCVAGLTESMVRVELKNRSADVKRFRVVDEITGHIVTQRFSV